MIYTFYSYKGGVGRTMALANVAELLYRTGLRVLMVDWDLEAPGLERYFPSLGLDKVLGKPGVIDMLRYYKEQMAQEPNTVGSLKLESPAHYILDVYPKQSSSGSLSLLTAGRRSKPHFAQYAQTVLTFDWQDFYENWSGEIYFNWLRDQFEALADVTLIDSRTGVTEIGGVCTYQLADIVVMFCTPNEQSVDGTYEMAQNLTSSQVQNLRRGRPLSVLVIPARIERAESDALDEFKRRFLTLFEPLIPERKEIDTDRLWNLRIPYVPKYAYKELVAARESDSGSAEEMAAGFRRLSQVLDDLRLRQIRKTVTWLHISDLQFRASDDYDATVILQALLHDIAERNEQDMLRPDMVFVTGDIAFSGKPEEYYQARRFFDDLLRTTGLSKDRLFLVPGNHDVDRSQSGLVVNQIGPTVTSQQKVDRPLVDLIGHGSLFAKFRGYAAFVGDYLGSHLSLDNEIPFYVQTLTLAGQKIAVLGVNSTLLPGEDAEDSGGLAIRSQLQTALEKIKEADLRVAVLHHPPEWFQKPARKDLEDLLVSVCDFVLHGHTHRVSVLQMRSSSTKAMIISAGACYETREYPNTYNLVRLDLTTGAGTVYFRRYSDVGGGFWAKDTLTYRNVPSGSYAFTMGSEQPPVSSTGDYKLKIDPDNPPLSTIREMLMQAFTPAMLHRFCQDRPIFRSLASEFAPGHGSAEMVDRLIEYCQTHLLWDELLSEVQQENPRQYARFESHLGG